MAIFDYTSRGFDVRAEIAQIHRTSWSSIARAGSQWTGFQRVEIARQARATRAARNEPPWLRKGLPEAEECLSDEAVDAARTIAADARKIDRDWAAAKIAALGEAAYVELGAIVATVSAIDAFAEALGIAHEALPEPVAGDPDGAVLDTAVDAGAYVHMMDPWTGPNVGRALSLVPEANSLFMANVMAMYSSTGGTFFDLVWDGPLSRPQAELLASRVAAVNECFY
ncbi:MAG: hypothetical protein GY725_23985 [bacterium]|nr:hypothetical protein [bacterium]